MNGKAWEWCVAELRDKSTHFNKHGCSRVLDTGSSVRKSDMLVSKALCARFQFGLESVLAHNKGHKQDSVFIHVDPSPIC